MVPLRPSVHAAPLLLALLAGCGGQRPAAPAQPAAPAAGAPAASAYGFDAALADAPLGDFDFRSHGPGRPAVWKVLAVPDAPSGKQVLAQLDDDRTNHRYNLALSPAAPAADVRVAVRGKAVAGGRDRSFGVVARWQDGDSYYLARVNTSGWGPNVRLYSFVHGQRDELASTDVEAEPGRWYELALEIRGDRLIAIFDGKQVLETRDVRIRAPGRAGVWTKAEAVSQFDDLVVTPLAR